jgi:hypothetical protein
VAATSPPQQDAANPSVGVLGIDSNFEPLTRAAYAYRQQHVYPYLESKGFTIFTPPAQPMAVIGDVGKSNVLFVTGVGHGLADAYLGDKYVPIFQVGQYAAADANQKIVHFLSCLTAVALGPSFVGNGCQAYFSYDSFFSYPPGQADTFFECDSEIDLAFADGLSAQQVHARVVALFNKRIADLQAAGNWSAAATLEFNRDALRSPASGSKWGDPGATLT